MALFSFGKTEKKIGGDHLRDNTTGKGGPKDVTKRQVAGNKSSDEYLLRIYQAGGFTQKIIDRMAKDAVREWFEIKCEWNGIDIGRLIQNRFDEFKLKTKIKDMMTWKGVFNTGSGIYISTSHLNQIGKQFEPIPLSTLRKIDFINVFDEPSRISLWINNVFDVTKSDYNKIIFKTNGMNVHEDRIRWVCDSFVPRERLGTSIAQACLDAIVAADNALWSSSSMLNEISMKIFKSKWLIGLSPTQRAEFLAQLSYTINSQSSIALDDTEELTRMTNGSLTGIKEIYDFIMDYLAGTAGISRLVLLGKAHGVVGSDDNEAMNYYASIKQTQISDIIPILDYLTKLVLNEKDGEIWKLTGGASANLDFEIKPNSLIELSPKAKAEVRLINSQADQVDVTIGKASPQEVREADDNYSELADPTTPVTNTPPLNFAMPPIKPVLDPKPAEIIPPK